MMIDSTEDEIFGHDVGACIKCGEKDYGIEPDARKYKCPSCGAHAVYGLEELLMMGMIRFEVEE